MNEDIKMMNEIMRNNLEIMRNNSEIIQNNVKLLKMHRRSVLLLLFSTILCACTVTVQVVKDSDSNAVENVNTTSSSVDSTKIILPKIE